MGSGINTETKRRAALRSVLPVPDGAVNIVDRAHALRLYGWWHRAAPAERTFTVPLEDRTYTVPLEDRTYTVPLKDRTRTV